MMCRRMAIIAGMLMLLSAVMGGASYVITEGYQRAFEEMVWNDGGTVLPVPKAKPVAAAARDEDPRWNILTPVR